ncbi:tubulin epsilon and delta complex protein 2 isoform X2 [Amia ocellicauda]|uniref:tubulin epsilon and delta complex protein 2 isoform X2 n=1 Tax=Amia ocellicauda TaxID=2972642 RepID=UPI0034649142
MCCCGKSLRLLRKGNRQTSPGLAESDQAKCWPPARVRTRRSPLFAEVGAEDSTAGRPRTPCPDTLAMLATDRSLRELRLAIQQCREEEERLQQSIRRCRTLLQPWRQELQDVPKEGLAPDIRADPSPAPEERREVDLLERVLEKALRVRSAAQHTEAGPQGSEVRRTASGSMANRSTERSRPMPGKELKDAKRSAATGGAHKESRGSRPLTRPSRVVRNSAGGASKKTAAPQRTTATPAVVAFGATPAAKGLGGSSLDSQSPVSQMTVSPDLVGGLGASPAPRTCQGDRQSPQDEGDRRQFTLKEHGRDLQLPAVWRKQRLQQCRLWDKVSASTAGPGPEQIRFTERLQSTFLPQLPSCTLVYVRREIPRLQRLCSALSRCLDAAQETDGTGMTPNRGTGSQSWTRECESVLTLEGLEGALSDLLHQTHQLRDAVDSWDRLSPGGCCAVRTGSSWGEAAPATRPPILCYSTPVELKELEGLRLKVDILRQQTRLHKCPSRSPAGAE